MTNISQIKVDSDWGTEAARINQNFQNMNTDLEKVKSATTKFRGYFTSEAGLKQKYPSPKVGDTAWVGEPYPGIVYDVVTDGTWHNTGKAPDTDSVDLTDYAKREELTELGNKAAGINYVTCDTAAGTAAKVVTVTGLTSLTTGIRLLVKMTNKNTASNATLNINSLGAKPLFYNNTRVSGDNAWEAGEVIDVYYDGTNFYSGNFQGGSGEGGNLMLEWNTDAATTRKQVKQSKRKSLLLISYKDVDGNLINEQYVGTSFADTEWIKDENWRQLANKSEVNIVKEEIARIGAYSIETSYTQLIKTGKYSTLSQTLQDIKKGDILSIKIKSVSGYTGSEDLTAMIRCYHSSNISPTSQYFLNKEKFSIGQLYSVILDNDIDTIQYSIDVNNTGAIGTFELIIDRKTESRNYSKEEITNAIKNLSDDGYKTKKYFGNSVICSEFVTGKAISSSGNPNIVSKALYTLPVKCSKGYVKCSDLYYFSFIARYSNDSVSSSSFIDLTYISQVVDNKEFINANLLPVNDDNYLVFGLRKKDGTDMIDGEENPDVWIDEEPANPSKSYYSIAEKKIYERVNYFKVKVHTNNPLNSNLQTIAATDFENPTEDEDCCLLMLPDGHSSDSYPCKVVVYHHGNGQDVYENTSIIATTLRTSNYLCYCGYAVLAVNGLPKKFSDDNELTYGRACGNWMAIESLIKAYSYVKDKFNLSDEIYYWGTSQGGHTGLNAIDYCNIPVKAAVFDSPVISIKYGQTVVQETAPGNNLKFFYGFDKISEYNRDSVCGLDPWIRNVNVEYNPYEFTKKGTATDEELNEITSKRTSKIPMFILQGSADGACPAWIAQSFVKQLKNAGQLIFFNLYDGVQHVVCDSTLTEEVGILSYNSRTYDIRRPLVDGVRFLEKYGGYPPRLDFIE